MDCHSLLIVIFQTQRTGVARLPTSADNAIFTSAGGSTALTVGTPITVLSIQFRTSAYSGATGYTVGSNGGNAITLANSGFIQILNTFTGTGITETIAAPITLAGNASIYNGTLPTTNNLLLISGAVTGTGSSTLTFGSTAAKGLVQVSGNITGVSALTLGAGTTLTLSGNNTITGNSTIEGNLILDYTTNNGAKISTTGTITLGGKYGGKNHGEWKQFRIHHLKYCDIGRGWPQ